MHALYLCHVNVNINVLILFMCANIMCNINNVC